MLGKWRVGSFFVVLGLVFISFEFCDGDPPPTTLERGVIRVKDAGRNPSSGLHEIAPCNRSRVVIKDSTFGIISDGLTNYTQDTTCEWLITAPPGHWISLKIDRVRTECSYDYLFIIDGLSYVNNGSRLLASFSGATDPYTTLLAQSGHMLILLYSDPNYVLEGFTAQYHVSPCPLNCSGRGECTKKSNDSTLYECNCHEQSSGFACQNRFQTNNLILVSPNNANSTISDSEENSNKSSSSEASQEIFATSEEQDISDSPLLITAAWQSRFARVDHSAVKIGESLWIYGGFDLNRILSDLVTLDLRNNFVKIIGDRNVSANSTWPAGRFGHSAVQISQGFIIHGGKNDKRKINDELYVYNISNGEWIELKDPSIPALMYHSMTRTASQEIFVYGGGTPAGGFSSALYRFNEDSPSKWSVVQSSCCGKAVQRSVLGHSMTFWPDKNALILFGGVGSSDFGHFSKLSSQMWIFSIDTFTWLHLDYRRTGGVPSGLHLERAFHTAHLFNHYLTIVGGYTHVHNRDETCYSDEMVVYNVDCQIFLPPIPSTEVSPSQGVFGHQSTLYRDEVLVIGGYRGYLNPNLKKYAFPFSKSKSRFECHSFDRWRCSGEPKCGWCTTNSKCFDKVSGASNCTTNLQTAQCPGLCPLLSSCQSCVIPGCVWCGIQEQCSTKPKDKEEATRFCNPHSQDQSIQFQTTEEECSAQNWRMGLTQYEFRWPPDPKYPDGVKIVNSSVLLISKEHSSVLPANSPVTFVLRGSIRGLTFSHNKKLEMCSLQSGVNVTLWSPEESLHMSHKWTDYQCFNLTWPSGKPVLLLPGLRIHLNLSATSFGKEILQEKSGRVSIQQKYSTGSSSVPRYLRREHLFPFSSSSEDTQCFNNLICTSCTGDASCLWNKDTSSCIPRKSTLKDLKLRNTPLILQPEDCTLCSDNNFCEECVSQRGAMCEWWPDDMTCHRRGRLLEGFPIHHSSDCPTSCSSRTNCSSCLESPGKCVWCEQKQECFIFSIYTSMYQYGQCFQWIDKAEQCRRCDKQPTCESCILNMGCGWSYDESGGVCSEGDFGGPYTNGMNGSNNGFLDSLLGDLSNRTWTYGECPDVDECELGIHDCHENATCVNSPGSFSCICRQGFTGDGRSACDQTCAEPCVHGTCSPNFECECDLGWTGTACSIDCGCNNHSFCESGSCDECKEYTTGEKCELCFEGSYGNATDPLIGCTPCHCNGHGDASLGLCDSETGHCFCLHNTGGKDCSECKPGFYGDPGDSRHCYKSCTGRALLHDRSEGYFGLPQADVFSRYLGFPLKKKDIFSGYPGKRWFNVTQQKSPPIQHCMWIIRVPDSSEDDDTPIKLDPSEPKSIVITIEPGFHIPCAQNVLLIYRGYSNYGVDGRKIPLVAAVCNPEGEVKGESSKVRVVVVGKEATVVLKYGRMGSVAKFHFNAHYKTVISRDIEEERTGEGMHLSKSLGVAGGVINVTKLYEGPSQSVLSRFGHSLHVDQRNLWIFGGYSLSHGPDGPLNDIRHFSRDSNSWVPLTITVSQNEEAVPPPRYFHGGVMVPSQEVLIHGGISVNLTFLADSWKFDTKTSHWEKFCKGPSESPKLAGHTLTLREGKSSETAAPSYAVIMIGGFNPEDGFSDKVYTAGSSGLECWTEIETSGSAPLGIYGHSTVYHKTTDTFYVFGGVLHDIMGLHQVSISSRLFVLHWPTKRWSVLAPMEEKQIGLLPPPRFLHSSVVTDSYMTVLGGIGNSSKNSSALIYVIQCNLWLLLGTNEDVVKESSILEEHNIYRQAAAIAVWNNSEIFQMGGWAEGTTSESLFFYSVPEDACNLQPTKGRCKGTFGCSYCSSNNNRTQQCYNSEIEMPSLCSSGASNIEFWQGSKCSSLKQQNCERFATCTECLAGWPNHPNVTQGCHWCTNGKIGRCIKSEKYEEDSPCGKQWEITDSNQCPERSCSSPQCDKCTASGKCIWTRQILRSRERSWELRLQPMYDWNCVRKQIQDSSPSVSIVASPPASCPIPCWHFDSCQECLESPGAEGGFHQCLWSVNQNRCVSPTYVGLICFGGICGPILKGSPAVCPRSCATFRSCSSCLENPSCGWCAIEGENGEGVCVSPESLSENGMCANKSKWHYLQCPQENECMNGHHSCDSTSEQCIDLDEGYRCQCREGYERSDTSCIPICSEGCIHGTCKEPGKCVCNFGYVGTNCSFQCDCNGHSDCAGVDRLDDCLDCKNNTMGPKCSKCKPMYVGDPKNNGACIACIDYCNGHSSICLSEVDYNKWCNETNKYLPASQLMSKILASGIQSGPSTTAFCCHCKNQTSGDTCNDCIHGYFRGYDDKRLSCRKCECQGHGDTCDPVTGNLCNCHNNTDSEHCSQNSLKQNPLHQCWKHQCSKCKEFYLGTPTNGHQCYKQMHVDKDYCFDPKTQEACTTKQKPLLSGRTVFFAVQPKFMNVNIRVTLDVTHGAINVYLSPKDDTFVIKQDEYNWVHRVEFDAKYGLSGEKKEGSFFKETFGTGTENNKVEPDYEYSGNNKSDFENNITNRIIPKLSRSSLNTPAYRFIEQEAAGYATYYSVQDSKAVLLVKNLRNRLVITLPQDSHDLRLTRFYLVLEGVGDVSYGSIFFRQDQLHIDLFVFFSVFFSAFFLFLAACGVAWKVKQNMEYRRARHRHVAEMLSMAKRPFGVWTLLMEPTSGNDLIEAYNQCRKSCRKGCICIRPVAVEWTAGSNSTIGVCSMFIRLPGGSNAPVRLCIGSVLSNLQRSHVPYHARRRRLHQS